MPLGPIFNMAPYNFPIWLAFKSIIPKLTLGNTIILKGADCCTESTLTIEQIFKESGWGDILQSVILGPEEVEFTISHPKVRGVSFTGSTQIGKIIAGLAGSNLKKCVMELGGSDPFIVRHDADVDLAVELLIKSRIPNAGQICFSAKRMIVHESLYDSLKIKLIGKLNDLMDDNKIGNPMDENVIMGPLAREDILDLLERQIQLIQDTKSGNII